MNAYSGSDLDADFDTQEDLDADAAYDEGVCDRCGDRPLLLAVHDKWSDNRAGCVNCGLVPGDEV